MKIYIFMQIFLHIYMYLTLLFFNQYRARQKNWRDENLHLMQIFLHIHVSNFAIFFSGFNEISTKI